MVDTYIPNNKGQPTIFKDPKAILDYTFDWSVWLAGISDTISASLGAVSFTIDAVSGATIVSQSNTSTTATVWIAGGQSGTSAIVTCQIKTFGVRTDDRLIIIKFKER